MEEDGEHLGGFSFSGAHVHVRRLVSVPLGPASGSHVGVAGLTPTPDDAHVVQPPKHRIEYLTVPIADAVFRNILLHFKRHYEFVETIRSSRGGAVLVHCAAGVSRSSTLVLAYLMRKMRWQYSQAFSYVA